MTTQISNNEVATLKTAQLIPFTLGNSRIKHNTTARNQLQESIKAAGGVLQPILVRPTNSQDKFEVIAGFGRFEACKELGFDVPVLIKEMSDSEAYEAQLIENLVREDLSIVDEAKAAQRFIAMYEGDYNAAAERLGWTTKKINDRIQLLRCCDAVLDALNENTIKIGHAIVLSSFSEKLQIGTLNNIIKEDWSVQYLKERAGKAKKFLHTAKFDVTDCSNCPHNTSHQIGMFDFESTDKAACAKLTCWNAKTDAWLGEQKKAAEEKYGKVILMIECSAADRNTVNADVVGESQYASGCANCESNVVIMDDRSGREGQTTLSQCIDKICYTKCITAFNTAQEPVEETRSENTDEITDNATAQAPENTATAPKPPAAVEQKTPQVVLDAEKKIIHEVASQIYTTEPWYINAIILASLVYSTGHKISVLGEYHNFEDMVIACKQVPVEDIQAEISKAIACSVSTEAKSVDTRLILNQQSMMIKALATHGNKLALVTAAWIPSESILKGYTTSGLNQLCVNAGFDLAYNDSPENQKNKATFAKLAGKTKAEFIKAILAFDFDWSAFAPSSLLKHIS